MNKPRTSSYTPGGRLLRQLLPLVLLIALCLPAHRSSAQYEYDDAYISYNDFYENLSPYGIWIEDPQYGYVWSPEQDGNFRPYYSGGHWVMTDYGNTWISDYAWGWACFHYGRWTYDSYYGWIWIPGSNWGPAWVSWRYGDGYYGWAPLGPNYEFTSNYGDYACPNDWWVFIPPQYVYTGNYYRYWYGPHSNSQIIHNTVFVNNTYSNNNVTYVSGPRARDVEQVTHQPVQVYKINNSNNLNTRVKHGIVKMYRPAEIKPTISINGSRPVPQNPVRAPQAIKAPQPVNAGQATTPQFRNHLPPGYHTETPGTGYNQTAQPERHQQPRNDANPYQWDNNKPEQHTQRPQAPQPGPTPAPAPTPAQQPRQAPQQNPAPQPRQNPNPAPAQQPNQQQPNPAPAPQQHRESGGGKR